MTRLKNYIDFFLPLLSFVTVCVGVLGETHNKDANGSFTITLLGFCCLIIGLLTFIATAVKLSIEFKEKSKKERLAVVAHIRVRDEIYGNFLWPFEVLYYSYLIPRGEYDRLNYYNFYPKLISGLRLLNRDMRFEKPNVSPRDTWCKLFKEFAVDGELEIDRLLTNYTDILNPLILIEIEKIKQHIFLRRLKDLTENYVSQDLFPFYLIHPHQREVEEYLSYIDNCLQIVRKTINDKPEDEFNYNDKRVYMK